MIGSHGLVIASKLSYFDDVFSLLLSTCLAQKKGGVSLQLLAQELPVIPSSLLHDCNVLLALHLSSFGRISKPDFSPTVFYECSSSPLLS